VHRDERAYARLYQLYVDRIYRFLAAKLPTAADAHDAAATVFLRAWNYCTSTQVDHLSGLLHTVARGVIAEFYRQRRETVSLDEDSSWKDTLSDGSAGAQQVQRDVDVSLVRRALNALPPDQARALSLRYLSDLPISAVAADLKRSVNATNVLLYRAVRSLRKLMEP